MQFGNWFSTGSIAVGNNAFGELALISTGITNASAVNNDDPGQQQILVGLNNSLGLLVELEQTLRYSIIAAPAATARQFVLAGGDAQSFGNQNDALDVGTLSRVDLAAGSLEQANPSGPINNNGVISGDDWTILGQAILMNNGTLEATAGAGPAVLAGLDVQGSGTLLIDAGGTLEISNSSEAQNDDGVTIGSGQVALYQPEFDGVGGLLSDSGSKRVQRLDPGLQSCELLEIDDANTTVQSAVYAAGSNITNVAFAYNGNTAIIAFAGSLTPGKFVLDPNQPASATLFDYSTAGVADQPPVLSGPTDISATDNVANAIPGLSLSDSDAVRLNQTITLTFTVNNGTLSATRTTNAAISGGGTGTLTIVGALPAVLGDLAGIGFTPQPQSDSTITITATDGVTTTPATLSILAHEQQPGGRFFTGTANYVFDGPLSDNFDDLGAWQDTAQAPYAAAPGIADSATIAADTAHGFEDVIGGVGVAGQLLTEGAVVLTGSLTLAGSWQWPASGDAGRTGAGALQARWMTRPVC